MKEKEIEILDCTLRDGGYYTEWDFDDNIVETYLKSCESLPIDYLEVGYRSPAKSEYYGKYFYCPKYILEDIKRKSSKKIAILLNEKDVAVKDLDNLLGDYLGLIDLVRVAVNPANIVTAIELARGLKAMGYTVAFNVMYMSTWSEIEGFYDKIEQVNGLVDYFYLVDSFGGVYPDQVSDIIKKVKARTDAKIGFHGHNNLELGLINTLTALEAGADIVDATITGMGRGAGNLKMELLLTCLTSKYNLKVDFNALGAVVGEFESLQVVHQWGTSLPYMVSGAHSLPQKDVMEWVGKRYYSVNSIIQALNNQNAGVEDNMKLKSFNPIQKFKSVLIIGGGPSVVNHADALNQWVLRQEGICIVHASSKNAASFTAFSGSQVFCLVGNEGHRLEERTKGNFDFVSECILPPFPRKMGTYIPPDLESKSSELEQITFTDKLKDSHTVLALQAAIALGADKVFVAGYDGYSGSSISQVELELSKENERLFVDFREAAHELVSLTPTEYDPLNEQSVYSLT